MKRVLLIHSNLWLATGVESLLSREKDLELAGVSLNNVSSLFDVFEKFKPEVVILDLSLTHLTTILRFVTDNFEIRLILLSVQDNFIHLIHCHKIPVLGVGDLVAVIREGTPTYSHQNPIDSSWG